MRRRREPGQLPVKHVIVALTGLKRRLVALVDYSRAMAAAQHGAINGMHSIRRFEHSPDRPECVANGEFQFSVGCATLSMTMKSRFPRSDWSLSPSCSRRAVKIPLAPSARGATASGAVPSSGN